MKCIWHKNSFFHWECFARVKHNSTIASYALHIFDAKVKDNSTQWGYIYSIEKHKTTGLVRLWVYWPGAKITGLGPVAQCQIQAQPLVILMLFLLLLSGSRTRQGNWTMQRLLKKIVVWNCQQTMRPREKEPTGSYKMMRRRRYGRQNSFHPSISRFLLSNLLPNCSSFSRQTELYLKRRGSELCMAWVHSGKVLDSTMCKSLCRSDRLKTHGAAANLHWQYL